jgi:hypothetical protein
MKTSGQVHKARHAAGRQELNQGREGGRQSVRPDGEGVPATVAMPVAENLLVEGFAKCCARCATCGGTGKASDHGTRNRAAQCAEGAAERANCRADFGAGKCCGYCAGTAGSGTNRTADPSGDMTRLSP